MKTLFSRHKWMQIVFGALFLVAGILIIVFTMKDPDRIATWLSVILAIALFLFGASCIFSGIFSLKSKYFDPAFIYGDLAIALGVVLCFKSDMIDSFIVIFVGTMLTTIGVVFIGEATSMIFFKRPKVSIVLFFIFGAAFLTLGVLSYVFQGDVRNIIYFATGVLMSVVGVVQILFGIVATIRARKDKRDLADQTQEVIDNEPEPIPQIVDVQTNDDNNNGSDA